MLVNPVSRRSLFGRVLGAGLMISAPTPRPDDRDLATYITVRASINPVTGAWTHLGAPLPAHGHTVAVRLAVEEPHA